jgi:thioredoxin reductase (NADPH)
MPIVEKSSEHDVIVIGGGPAGLSAALSCADLGLKTVLFERHTELGGQLLNIHNTITNYPGIRSTDGRTLRNLFVSQLHDKGADIRLGAEVVKADLSARSVELSGGLLYSGRTLILATGVRRRKLGVPGEDEFLGLGVLESGVKQKNEVAGKTVVIAGGGDAAIENAIILSEKADKVVVVHRSETFRARPSFVETAVAAANVDLITGHEVCAIVGTDKVQQVDIKNNATGEIRQIPADAVLIRVGVEPNSELFAGQLDLDPMKYARIDSLTSAGVEGVYAIGDLVNPMAPLISTATGQGTMAGWIAANLKRGITTLAADDLILMKRL